jgi:hypothetical protein
MNSAVCGGGRTRRGSVSAAIPEQPLNFQPRPKGMWRRTYERLCAQAVEAEERAGDALLPYVARLLEQTSHLHAPCTRPARLCCELYSAVTNGMSAFAQISALPEATRVGALSALSRHPPVPSV